MTPVLIDVVFKSSYVQFGFGSLPFWYVWTEATHKKSE